MNGLERIEESNEVKYTFFYLFRGAALLWTFSSFRHLISHGYTLSFWPFLVFRIPPTFTVFTLNIVYYFWVIVLSVCLSICLFIYLSNCQYIFLFDKWPLNITFSGWNYIFYMRTIKNYYPQENGSKKKEETSEVNTEDKKVIQIWFGTFKSFRLILVPIFVHWQYRTLIAIVYNNDMTCKLYLKLLKDMKTNAQFSECFGQKGIQIWLIWIRISIFTLTILGGGGGVYFAMRRKK